MDIPDGLETLHGRAREILYLQMVVTLGSLFRNICLVILLALSPGASLVPSPQSPCGEGSDDIGTVSWLYRRVA